MPTFKFEGEIYCEEKIGLADIRTFIKTELEAAGNLYRPDDPVSCKKIVSMRTLKVSMVEAAKRATDRQYYNSAEERYFAEAGIAKQHAAVRLELVAAINNACSPNGELSVDQGNAVGLAEAVERLLDYKLSQLTLRNFEEV